MNRDKIKNRILTVSIIMVLVAILCTIAYIYLGINQKLPTANATYETHLMDSYNYKNDFSNVIRSSNKNMLEQYSKLDDSSNCISQLTIQAMMYNIANKDSKKINTIFKRFDNGYDKWESADRIFKNMTVFYANGNPFTLQYANNLVNTELDTKVDVFKDEEKVTSASAIGVYKSNIVFDEQTYTSVMNTIVLAGPHFVAHTEHLDVIKVPIEGNKAAILIANNGVLQDIKYKDYLSELKDVNSLTFNAEDIKVEITPFTKITSGIPGAILTDMKTDMIDWDEKFNGLLVVNYVQCENTSTSEDEPMDYDMVYVMKNNYIMLIQDNNTKLIECICDLTE